MFSITSNQNAFFKDAKALKQKKFREEKKCFLIEGVRFVNEAINEGIVLQRIFMSERLISLSGGRNLLEFIMSTGTDVYEVSDKMLEELCETENPQGLVAVVNMQSSSIDEVVKPNGSYVVLDCLQDPGNMGAIIRTADAAGFDGVIALNGCVDVYNSKVLRSTMGSIFHIPVLSGIDIDELFCYFNQNRIKTYAAHLKAEKSYFEEKINPGVAILIGNEANGLSDEVAKRADTLVIIPMPGRAESLNASVAAALLMYEVVRRKELNYNT